MCGSNQATLRYADRESQSLWVSLEPALRATAMNTTADFTNQDEGPAPIDRKTALADALKRRIVSMELAPGAVVDEVALSTEFGLSRPPVRELLRQMAAEGYIELEANRAARVSSMSYQSLRNFFLVAPMIYIATS